MIPFKNPFKKKNPLEQEDISDAPGLLARCKDGAKDVREKSAALYRAVRTHKKTKPVLMTVGASLAIAGMAADVVFLGGAGTLLVGSCLYGDLRNAQHLKKLSTELAKIDEKIDSLTKEHKPLPDYAPTLSAVQDRIAAFQKAAEKLPPEIVRELAELKDQVTALQHKIAPANDDRKKPPGVIPAKAGIYRHHDFPGSPPSRG